MLRTNWSALSASSRHYRKRCQAIALQSAFALAITSHHPLPHYLGELQKMKVCDALRNRRPGCRELLASKPRGLPCRNRAQTANNEWVRQLPAAPVWAHGRLRATKKGGASGFHKPGIVLDLRLLHLPHTPGLLAKSSRHPGLLSAAPPALRIASAIKCRSPVVNGRPWIMPRSGCNLLQSHDQTHLPRQQSCCQKKYRKRTDDRQWSSDHRLRSCV